MEVIGSDMQDAYGSFNRFDVIAFTLSRICKSICAR
jgi:hypothetical protein